MTSDIEVDALTVPAFQANLKKYVEELDGYARIIIHPLVRSLTGVDFASARALNVVPAINFAAYHPDIAYMNPIFGKAAAGPMRDYQSIILLAAFAAGFDEARAREYFNGSFYERVGYMDLWDEERDALIARYSQAGLEISDHVRAWGRSSAFMYSINHPRIQCLYDIAEVFLNKIGVKATSSNVLPADLLTNGPCWPVYPEVAEFYGVTGSRAARLLLAEQR